MRKTNVLIYIYVVVFMTSNSVLATESSKDECNKIARASIIYSTLVQVCPLNAEQSKKFMELAHVKCDSVLSGNDWNGLVSDAYVELGSDAKKFGVEFVCENIKIGFGKSSDVASSENSIGEFIRNTNPTCEVQFSTWVLITGIASVCNLQPQTKKIITDYGISVKADCNPTLTREKIDGISEKTLTDLKKMYAETIEVNGQDMGEKLFCRTGEDIILRKLGSNS